MIGNGEPSIHLSYILLKQEYTLKLTIKFAKYLQSNVTE